MADIIENLTTDSVDITIDNFNYNFRILNEAFKVKKANWYIAIVQEIKKDMIRIKNKYYSYKSFMQSLSSISIEGSVNIIANYTTDADLIDDEMLKINLVPLIVKSRSSSTNKFIKGNQGNIFLLSESKILDDDCIAIQML